MLCVYLRKVLQLQIYLNVWIAVQAVDNQMMHIMSCLHTSLSATPSETSRDVNANNKAVSCSCHQVVQLAMQTDHTSMHALWTASVAVEQCHTKGPGRWSYHPQLHLVSCTHAFASHLTKQLGNFKGRDRLQR